MMNSMLQKITLATCGVAAIVIVLGTYTRLVDAGLGCPDWPGCYGFLSVPTAVEELKAAESLYPNAPLDSMKAWVEMVHRYAATGLGALVLLIFILAWREKRNLTIPLSLVILVVVQGIFGAWTVTLKLWPQVVTAHLLGGFATLALLWAYTIKIGPFAVETVPGSLRRHAYFAISVVVIQVALGGWTSSNYAALACPDFPLCHGKTVPKMDLIEGFDVFREIGPNYLGGWKLSNEGRVAIQVVHRIGALVVLFVTVILAIRLRGVLGRVVGGIVVAQFIVGIVNVLLSLPLGVAVLHNAMAAMLLLALITVVSAESSAESNVQKI